MLELKLWRTGALENVLETGIPQTLDYARQCGAEQTHLLIFDRKPGSDWETRVWQREETRDGQTITMWGA